MNLNAYITNLLLSLYIPLSAGREQWLSHSCLILELPLLVLAPWHPTSAPSVLDVSCSPESVQLHVLFWSMLGYRSWRCS